MIAPTRANGTPLLSDATGELYGLPVFAWQNAPDGYATRRQLAAKGLRKAGQPIAAYLIAARGSLIAYLYRVDLAKPQFRISPAKAAAVWTAARSRRRCVQCDRRDLEYIPQQVAPAWGRCWTCMGFPEWEPTVLATGCSTCGGDTTVPCLDCAGACSWMDPCLPCGGRGVVDCAECLAG